MRNYQSVLILKPDLDEAQVEQNVEKVTEFINRFGGTVLKLDKWGKKRLAYRIRKSKFGYYLNIYHTCEQAKVPDLEKEYQLYEMIIKYLVIRLEERDIERVMKKAADAEAAKKADEVKAEEAKAEEATKAEEAKTEEPAKAEEAKAEEPAKADEAKTEEPAKAAEKSE